MFEKKCFGRGCSENTCRFFSVVDSNFTRTPHFPWVELWCWLVPFMDACISNKSFCDFTFYYAHFEKSIDFEKFVQDCNKLFNMDIGGLVGTWLNFKGSLCFVFYEWHSQYRANLFRVWIQRCKALLESDPHLSSLLVDPSLASCSQEPSFHYIAAILM